MTLFRRSINLSRAVIRSPEPQDGAALRSIVYRAERRLVSTPVEEIAAQLLSDPSVLLELDGRVQAAASIGWRTPPVAWLRTLLLEGRLPVDDVFGRLMAPLYGQVGREGVELVIVTLDEWTTPWLRGPIGRLGYRQMVDVIGYQKQQMTTPDRGNQQVVVRRAVSSDLPAILRVDGACFTIPWVKGPEIIVPAIADGPCFYVAEVDERVIGYAWATVHHGGQLVHLVRIAVEPGFHGERIGVRLLNEVVDFCVAHASTTLTLNTQGDNYHAQRLYEWFGFTRNDDRQAVYGYQLPR